MAFNPDVKRKIVRDRKTDKHLPCPMCGASYPLPDAAHIIDEKEWKAKVGCDRQSNGIPLCPNCHRVIHWDQTRCMPVSELRQMVERMRR